MNGKEFEIVFFLAFAAIFGLMAYLMKYLIVITKKLNQIVPANR